MELTYQDIREAIDNINDSLNAGRINSKQHYKAMSKIIGEWTSDKFKGPGISQTLHDELLRLEQHAALSTAFKNAQAEYARSITFAEEKMPA